MDIDLLYRLQRRWWPLCSPGPPHPNMFNLMSNCYSWLSKLQEPIRKVTILVVGLDKAGKTSSVRGMLRGLNTSPTHGCVRSELRVDNYLVSLLDVGGAPESRAVWREVYGDVHGIIFVVDSSDRQRIKEVKDVLSEMLKQPRVAGKPILVLANKQDKVNALLGSELIEVLSLEKLVNQSRSLCHIEPCSASTDLRRWADKKTLRGLQWLLRAVCLDYPELCARVAQDRRRPLAAPGDADKPRRAEKGRRKKTKEERLPSGQSDLRQEHRPKEKEKMLKSAGKMQPIRNMLKKENTLKKKLKRSKKKQVKIEDDMETQLREEPQQNDEHESSEEGQEASGAGQKEKARSPLIPPKKEKGKLRRKKKVNEHKPIQDVPQSPEENEELSTTAKEETRKKKKKKKVVKVKRKNKINTEDMPADALSSGHPQVDLSATLDLYRKAILTMKERQDLGE